MIDTEDVNSRTKEPYTPTDTECTNNTSHSSKTQENTSSGESDVNDHSGHGNTDREEQAEETESSLFARKEIEQIGMEHARSYEESQGSFVEDVSADNLGLIFAQHPRII